MTTTLRLLCIPPRVPDCEVVAGGHAGGDGHPKKRGPSLGLDQCRSCWRAIGLFRNPRKGAMT